MQMKRLAALPRRLDDGRCCDAAHLHLDVDLAGVIETRLGREGVEQRAMLAVHHDERLQPVVDEGGAVLAEGAHYAAATVVAADDDMFHFQGLDGELKHGENVHVARVHHVGDVAMHEHLARVEVEYFVGGDPAVRATDPQIAGRLLLREAGEERRIGPGLLFRPSGVALKEMAETGHCGSHAGWFPPGILARLDRSHKHDRMQSKPCESR